MVDSMTESDAKKLISEIADKLDIGIQARTPCTILTNIDNAVRRSNCLSLIEDLHTITMTDVHGEEFEYCPFKWGESPEQYIETYKRLISGNLEQSDALRVF